MELPKVDPSLKKSANPIPKDDSTRKKITEIIDHQFDLEIYLKQREVATIRQQIAKAESILSDLKQAIENETLAATMPEAAHYTRRSAMYYHGGSQALLNQSNLSTPVKRKVYRTSEKSRLFGRRNDGVYVSLACPACHRDDFANQQGFLNHCRISHNLEFGPYEQIMLQCGTPVDESEVPLDNPARLRPVMNLVPSSSRQPQKKLERPSIKVFEEDVDMELENERRSTNVQASIDTPLPPPVTDVPTPNTDETKELRKTNNENTEKENRSTTSSKALPEKDKTENTAPMKEATSSEEIAPAGETAPTEEMISTKDATHTKDETVTSITAAAISSDEPESKSNSNETPTVESFAAAMSSDIGSRFYIKRRIIVGNVSKYISPERRDPSLKQFTHKWMIYVVEPPQSKQEVSAFITCVRFHLHPSYKPHDVVDVTEAPFKLTRLGWGEFPIRIQLFFVDKRRNKTVDLIHHLKLDDTHSGKQLLGSERSIEIELDRNTDFKDTSSIPSTSNGNNTPQTPQEVTTAEPPASMAAKQRMSLLGGILKECVRRLPIVRAGSHGTVLPYSCASSSKMFFKWSVGKRKALEWHRAQLLRVETQKRAFEVNDNVLRIAAESLTTKDVVVWCKENKYTPVKSDTVEEIKESNLPLGYCKFCGSLRDGHDETIDDNCPRRPRGWNSRKRNGGINSITSVTKLLSTLESGWEDVKEADDEMDIDVDMDEGPAPRKEQVNRRNDISERVQDWTLDSEAMDIANERNLDWIWSVVGQLRLKSVIANDMLLAKDGNLQGPTSSFDLSSAMSQRLVVGNILAQATKAFLKKLVQRTVNTCRKEEEGSADKLTKMMVPYHVYQAAQNTDEFDFLTNQHMGPEEKEETVKNN